MSNWDEMFDEFWKELKEQRKMMTKLFRDIMEDLEKWTKEEPPKFLESPKIFGYRIIWHSGMKRPIIETFGNVGPGKFGLPKVQEEVKPIYDFYDEEDHVKYIIDVPGVEKENLDLTVSGNKLILKTKEGAERKYALTIDLPPNVKPEEATAEYKNGVLIVKIPKTKKEPKGTKIRIE